jgi:hypothetical protein
MAEKKKKKKKKKKNQDGRPHGISVMWTFRKVLT